MKKQDQPVIGTTEWVQGADKGAESDIISDLPFTGVVPNATLIVGQS